MENAKLYISAFDKSIAEKFTDIIRELGRVTQRPLWGEWTDDLSSAKHILFLESSDEITNVHIYANSRDAQCHECIYFTNEKTYPIRIFCQYLNGDNEVELRCDEEKLKTVFARVEETDGMFPETKLLAVEPEITDWGYFNSIFGNGIISSKKTGAYEKTKPEQLIWNLMKESRVAVITDIFGFSAARAVVANMCNETDAVVMHITGEGFHIYVPEVSYRIDCFRCNDRAFVEAMYCIVEWLYTVKEFSAAARLEKAMLRMHMFEGTIDEKIKLAIKHPVRSRDRIK